MRWTDEMEKWLFDNNEDYTAEELAEIFNCTFGCNVTRSSIQHKKSRLGIESAYDPRTHANHCEYSKEQDEWIINASPLLTWEEITNAFNDTFGTSRTKDAIAARGGRLGKRVNQKSREKVGEVNRLPIGAERYYDKYDSIIVKTGNRNKQINGHKGWELKHHHIWEEAHGELPDGARVIFLDGNRNNFDLDNLYATTNAVTNCMVQRFGNLSELASKVAALRLSELMVEMTKDMTKAERKKFWRDGGINEH